MCGRYTLTYGDLSEIAEALDAVLDPAAAELYRPRYNIAPSNTVVVAREREGGAALVPASWGLRRHERFLINARAESAATRFREAYAHGRCVIPADGFYEWTGERSERRPLWFHRPDGRPLFLAGVLDERPEAPPAFAVLTTAAAPPVAAVHERMPVVLSAEDARRWLLGPPPRVLHADDVGLVSRAVSPRANAIVHDDPACLAPEGGPTKSKQLGLF